MIFLSLNIIVLANILEFGNLFQLQSNPSSHLTSNYRDRYLKFDLVLIPSIRKTTTTKMNRRTINNFNKVKRKKSYVWDSVRQFWTDYSNINTDVEVLPNVSCEPPYCIPRNCKKLKCNQRNCLFQPKFCQYPSTDCGIGQKAVMFGRKVVCIDKDGAEDCAPRCGSKGICIQKKCYCEAGFSGPSCQIMNADMCKEMNGIICANGCAVDIKDTRWRCVCGPNEGKSDCLEMRICAGGCENGGVCVAGKCRCSEEFVGSRCEHEINFCSPGLMGNITCQQVCVAQGRGSFSCACLDGYSLNNDSKTCDRKTCSRNNTISVKYGRCQCKEGWKGPQCDMDIDECKEINMCQHLCENTAGSYQCRCWQGFRVLNKGLCVRTCPNDCSNRGDCINGLCQCFRGWHGDDCSQDVDECKYNHGCEHQCSNLQGSFKCHCPSGQRLHRNGRNCVDLPCEDWCQNGGICRGDRCICKTGFGGPQCEHYCQVLCEQNCTTVNDALACSCWPGYSLKSDNRSCVRDCRCLHGRCVDGVCHCQPGYSGTDCSDDVNECETKRHGCDHGCVNTLGSYICTCRPEYSLQLDNRSCIRKGCGSCINGACKSDGTCECHVGFEGATCANDVDECQTRANKCQHLCVNKIGSYKCVCNPGYTLGPDRLSCYASCHLCKNGQCDPITGACQCKRGWTGELCGNDIDECILGSHNCEHNCINTNGSYECSCRPSYYLSNYNGRSCIKEDGDCSSPCKNGGRCKKGKCKCRAGYTGNSCEEDIDECLLNQHGCQGQCRNTFGNYECICRKGFVQLDDQKTCKMISKDTMCNPPCQNGGVCRDMTRCFCPSGFKGKDCSKDINECTQYQPCDNKHGTCINTHGSFYCQCRGSHVLMYDGVKCMTIREAILRPHLRYRGRGTKGYIPPADGV